MFGLEALAKMRVHTSSTAGNKQRDDTQPRPPSNKKTNNKGPQTTHHLAEASNADPARDPPSQKRGDEENARHQPRGLSFSGNTRLSLLGDRVLPCPSFSSSLARSPSGPVTAEIPYCLATVGGASIVADVCEGRLLSADWPGVTADPGPSP